MAAKRNVSYMKPQEPSFLKAFKEKVGYKDKEVTVDTKRQKQEVQERKEDEPYRHDELPVIVKGTDISEEEYQRYLREREEGNNDTIDKDGKEATGTSIDVKNEGEKGEDGKIKFKKPVKRSSSEAKVTSSTKKRNDKRHKPEGSTTAIKNANLLSFDDDDDD